MPQFPSQRAVHVSCTRRTAGPSAVRPYACQPRSAVARRHLGRRHPPSPPVELAPYLRRHGHPAGKQRAWRPPLSPSRQTRPSTSTSIPPITSRPSLGLAKARALTHCPAESPPHRHPEPPRPSPPATAARPRRSHLRPNSGHPCIIGEHVDEPDPFPSREHRRPRRIPASHAAPYGQR
jgi:hypothetical protein